MSRLVVVLAVAALAISALGRVRGFDQYRAVQDSLRQVHPRFHERWLKDRGLDAADYMPRRWHEPESTFLQLRGKWGRGRSVEVTGQDSLVFLSLGSEIAILDFSEPSQPQLLTELQLGFCPTQTYVRDSLLVAGGYSCIETWNISGIAQPAFLGRIPYSTGDFCVRDTLVYFVSSDTFRIFSIADPANPRPVGSCRDSGDAITVTNSAAFLADRWGLYALDVSDPTNPHRIAAYPGDPLAVEGRGNILCVTFMNPNEPNWLRFSILDVTNPANIQLLGSLDSAGGYDIYLSGQRAYVSGYYTGGHEFQTINIGDTTHPTLLGSCTTPGFNYGVWGSDRTPTAFVADDNRGLEVIDVTNPAQPVVDSSLMRADQAQDIWVDGNRCYVADGRAGLRILDVSNPAVPTELGGLDTLSSDSHTAVAADSFAFVGWLQGPHLRSIQVADPLHPVMAGSVGGLTVPEDMVLRDTFVYLAGRLRFQVVNVARPRNPVLVGSCVTGDMTNSGMYLSDTLAYVCSWPSDIVNVADPGNPAVVGSIPHYAENVFVVETLAYLANAGLFVYNVKNPAAPVPVDSLCAGLNARDVVVLDTLAYVGCYWDAVRVVSVADVHNMHVVGSVAVPQTAWRISYSTPYLYAACFDGGVCIFETTSTGLVEDPGAGAQPSGIRVLGSVTRGRAVIEFPEAIGKEVHLRVFDIAGNRVGGADVLGTSRGAKRYQLDLTGKAAGVYVVRATVGNRAYQLRITKLQPRR